MVHFLPVDILPFPVLYSPRKGVIVLKVPYHNRRSDLEPDLFKELALLWLKNQDFKDKAPEEVHTLFWDAYYRILHDYETKIEENVFDAY